MLNEPTEVQCSIYIPPEDISISGNIEVEHWTKCVKWEIIRYLKRYRKDN